MPVWHDPFGPKTYHLVKKCQNCVSPVHAKQRGEARMPTSNRDKVIAAIYDSVIRPERYADFMDLWGDHICEAMETAPEPLDTAGQSDALGIDPVLTEHFTRALMILDQLGRQKPRQSLKEEVAQSETWMLLLGRGSRVLAQSRVAQDWLGGQPLQERLDPHGAELMEALLGRLADVPGDASPVVLAVEGELRHLLARLVPLEGATGSAVLLESLDYHWSPAAERMLVQSFALSRAELSVVEHLLAGHNLGAIAEMTGKSKHTIRNQAKAVLAKTGAPGQAELIRLVVYMINQLSPSQAPPGASLGLDAQILRMGTGLNMQVFSLGPPDGMPVLFLHGMLEGVAVLRHLEEVLSRAGLRVVAPIRPGYGQSEQCDETPVLESFMAHLVELISRFELDRPVILGHLAGGFHGHILCHRFPDKVSGMLGIGSVAPIRSRRQLVDMAPRQKIVAFTARYLPSFLPTILRAGVAQIDSQDVKNFMGGLYPEGSHDREVIARLEIAPLIQAGYRLSVHQGHFGFLGDAPYMVRDWSDMLDCEAPAPVVYLMGAKDHVNRPEAVRAGFDGIDGIALHEVQSAGQLMFYEHPQLVIAALRELYEAAS